MSTRWIQCRRWHARVGVIWAKKASHKVQFSQMVCGRYYRLMEQTCVGHGKLGLRGWEAEIEPCVKGGFWQSAKTKGRALGFC
jgi:hypothetical protein